MILHHAGRLRHEPHHVGRHFSTHARNRRRLRILVYARFRLAVDPHPMIAPPAQTVPGKWATRHVRGQQSRQRGVQALVLLPDEPIALAGSFPQAGPVENAYAAAAIADQAAAWSLPAASVTLTRRTPSIAAIESWTIRNSRGPA